MQEDIKSRVLAGLAFVLVPALTVAIVDRSGWRGPVAFAVVIVACLALLGGSVMWLRLIISQH